MDTTFINSLGVNLPRLGFGCMRMPEDGQGRILVKETQNMLHTALEAGVDYFDTAYVYHGGKAEDFLGRHFFSALPRESFNVATKLPVFRIRELPQCEEIFREQLANLRLEHIDFYLAHSIDKESWTRFRDLGGADYLVKLRKEGRARYLGFSYHGAPDELDFVMDDFPWDFVQLQINYYDWLPVAQNARLQYETAVARNMPVIVMEPVRGGSLAKLPHQAAALLQAADAEQSQASWALRWVAGLPGVSMTLSGMSTSDQVAENLAIFSDFKPLSEAEQQTIAAVRQILYAQPHVDCTGCDYCKEACPQGVGISDAFERYNDYLRLEDGNILQNYLRFTPKDKWSVHCTACAACTDHCPQQLDIPGHLAKFTEHVRPHMITE